MINQIELEISTDNTFSDPLTIRDAFNFSLIGSGFSGIVTLQKRYKPADNWRDIRFFRGSFEGWDTIPGGGQIRFGIKPGEYKSGSIKGRMSHATA